MCQGAALNVFKRATQCIGFEHTVESCIVFTFPLDGHIYLPTTDQGVKDRRTLFAVQQERVKRIGGQQKFTGSKNSILYMDVSCGCEMLNTPIKCEKAES